VSKLYETLVDKSHDDQYLDPSDNPSRSKACQEIWSAFQHAIVDWPHEAPMELLNLVERYDNRDEATKRTIDDAVGALCGYSLRSLVKVAARKIAEEKKEAEEARETEQRELDAIYAQF
jgi:hypothetical protein